jgi:2,5-diamino-6-(ribosylamino)-4(3H)-pyrimidinone 5'-phosphate reductase
VTLTYACSLDSKISAGPGLQTILSGPASKAMTHYLRTKHDAILIGSGTALTDNPSLNSRLSDAVEGGLGIQPRPVVVDSRYRWDIEDSKVVKIAAEGRGKAPWHFIDVAKIPHYQRPSDKWTSASGVTTYHFQKDFHHVLRILHEQGIRSVMIEGGGAVINSLLSEEYCSLIDSVIITYAPVFLGDGGIAVSPLKSKTDEAVAKLEYVTWNPLEQDIVMCAKVQR